MRLVLVLNMLSSLNKDIIIIIIILLWHSQAFNIIILTYVMERGRLLENH